MIPMNTCVGGRLSLAPSRFRISVSTSTRVREVTHKISVHLPPISLPIGRNAFFFFELRDMWFRARRKKNLHDYSLAEMCLMYTRKCTRACVCGCLFYSSYFFSSNSLRISYPRLLKMKRGIGFRFGDDQNCRNYLFAQNFAAGHRVQTVFAFIYTACV